jgi:hypothetical protein
MPYDRDEVVASVTDFYNFLATHLHFEPSDLKTPSPTGWPKITQARFDFLGKSDKAIDILKHLPYLPPYGLFQKEIYTHTVCVDYNQESVDRRLKNPKLCITRNFEPDDDDNCPFDIFKERHEDVVVLGMPEKVSSVLPDLLSFKFRPTPLHVPFPSANTKIVKCSQTMGAGSSSTQSPAKSPSGTSGNPNAANTTAQRSSSLM